MNLSETIAQICAQKVNALQPADMLTGTVTSADPLEIKTDVSSAYLKSVVIILTDAVKKKEITVAGETVEITPALSAGDKVLLLQVQHGQKFIVLSKI